MCNEKTKTGNKGTLAVLLSIAALVLCLLVFVLWIFETIPHSVVTPDSFIGACVTLLSILVTVGIGWQIFNVVEVKNTMKELKERQEEVEKLRVEIKRIKDESEDAKHYSAHLHAMTLSMIYADASRYDIAFIQSLTALAECMQMKDPLNANFIIKGIKTCLDKHKGSIFVKQAVKQDVLAMNQIVRKSKDFSWIELEYDEIYKQYMSRLKVEGE